jgi:C4-dicarboxylate-specific signal transduction histidine kinase
MKSSIFRPIQLVLLGTITLILLALLATSWLTWREQARLARARETLATSLAFHEQHGRVEQGVIAVVTGTDPGLEREHLVAEIDGLHEICPPGDSATREHLTALRSAIASLPQSPSGYARIVELLHEIAESEVRYSTRRLADLYRESDAHLHYELVAPLSLLAIIVIALPITRRRVMKPLEDFGRQMSDLADGDFTPPSDEEVSSHTLPLHRKFIKLALRLQELEREQRERAESLEEEVRSATAALLEQQQSLARAERLAVAGELAASVAHEIRNPLAGIQMSLANLRHELDEAALRDRIDVVVAEVDRLARLVGEIVDAARHEPEPPTIVDVREVVQDLLSLVRYQLPPGIRVDVRIAEDLRARLPRERLRQALLNLVLNATTAIGDASGTIVIEADRDGDDLRIEVSDDGPGFPEELVLGGIRPFHSTRSRGAGLGLAMVRRFVRDAEGSMRIENRAESGERPGARVTLLLPSAVEHG